MPDPSSLDRRTGTRPAQFHAIDCVVLTCFEGDFRLWATLFRFGGIRMIRAETLEEADFLLTVTGATVMLVDIVFLDGTWKDALSMAARSHPHVPAVVVAEKIDEPFVADAVSCGALCVFWKPIHLDRLTRMIRLAHEISEERALWLRNLRELDLPAVL